MSPLTRWIHRPQVDLAWGLLAEALTRYFRLEVEGLENIPKGRPAVFIANHSGFAGFDAIVLTHLLHARLARKTRILAHPFYFRVSRLIRNVSRGFGLRSASVRGGIRALRSGQSLVVFPEAESGNFKSSLKRYRLQTFHTGFVRIAGAARVPVVPCLVIGAEESNWNLGSIGVGRLRVPLPLNIFPLPVRWKIRFLPPLKLKAPRCSAEERRAWMRRIALATRLEMQESLDRELGARNSIFR